MIATAPPEQVSMLREQISDRLHALVVRECSRFLMARRGTADIVVIAALDDLLSLTHDDDECMDEEDSGETYGEA